MISAATRLSAQPNTTAFGVCAAARLARRSMLWLGCCGLPATNRSLPSLSALQAGTGFEVAMLDIVPPTGWRTAMTVGAAELLGRVSHRVARPAVAQPRCHRVADPGQRVHASADSVGAVQPPGSTGWRIGAHAIGRGRRAAGLRQAGLTWACELAEVAARHWTPGCRPRSAAGPG